MLRLHFLLNGICYICLCSLIYVRYGWSKCERLHKYLGIGGQYGHVGYVVVNKKLSKADRPVRYLSI